MLCMVQVQVTQQGQVVAGPTAQGNAQIAAALPADEGVQSAETVSVSFPPDWFSGFSFSREDTGGVGRWAV